MEESELKVKQCSIINDQIKDERSAVATYHALARLLKESENPGVRAMAILAEKLADDEQSHMNALEKFAQLHCPK
jgi:rubrerythrin